ncbi:MAG TPA: hypothetical protein VM049_13095 [Gaiellaceae bacterium]|nr:hypothetical protein [Gaiellaceae bacterium]
MGWIQRGLAGVTAAIVAYLAVDGRWPFDASPAEGRTFEDPSVWQYLLSDRYVLGLLQLALVALSLYIVISVPALAAAARWAKGFGTTGVTTDDAARATRTLEDYERELADVNAKLDLANETNRRLQEQRDTAVLLLQGVTTTTTPAGGAPVGPPIVREERQPDDTDGHKGETGRADPGGEADR